MIAGQKERRVSGALCDAALDRIATQAGISRESVVRVLEMKVHEHRTALRENARRLLEHAVAAYAAERELVYFLQAEGSGRIKIGTTKDLGQRLRALRAGSPVKLELLGVVRGGRQMEQLIHIAFAPLRAGRSEWFEPGKSLLSFIRDFQRSEATR
jgi:hypothetical protein